ncbi:Zn-dependent amino-or carboxypeptidase, M28 family [Amycolatopsis marina]|uniref:Zn-dependent amino-or carboxypeptidase, M28 family n=1 Tax=Amycolatopsis marina TaxID=490629 RepID=A0A1I0XMW3_9PSEU|nr:M28 family metallopeptidase [Amycolatopsis marina]SFB01518.1 Zn-dependent amino-or carboxypeptidase, M28 family [Amycolatopsis marina]
MSTVRKRLAPAVAIAACAGLVLTSTPAAAVVHSPPSGPALAKKLVKKVKVGNINRHLIAMQRISDSSGGNRASGTSGYDRSAEYVAGKLAAAGYEVTRQEFPFTYSETLAESLTVGGTDVPIILMSYSPSTPEDGITAPLAVIEPDETPGCDVADFGDVTGQIALIQRGACSFAQKQAAAADAGAVGAVVYNNEDGALNGTLGSPDAARIPTGGISKAAGESLIGQDGTSVTLELRALQEERSTYNVIAETKTGRKDNVVMAGAHLDSTTEGAGINDNGTGSAGLLETALQLGGSPKVNNAVRFAWWGAEEVGLVGSNYYVDQLSFEQQLDISMYLNFDMIGSPNAGYFVYDGDDSDGEGAGAGPYGSAQIESAFVDYLQGTGTPTEGTDFSGRSDYGRFISVGIPAGGLFTGAEGIKTEAQAAKWGGRAGVAYDPCYHTECDNLGNVDRTALDRNSDALAWVTARYAISTEEVNGVAPFAAKSKKATAQQRVMQRAFTAQVAGDPHANVR